MPALATLRKSQLSVLAAAALFSTGGAAIKASALSASQIAGFRSGVAAPVLLLLVPAARRRWTLPMVLVGGAQAATFMLFVHANRLTTAANTTFLQATAPLYVLLLAPWLLKERPQARDVPFIAGVLLGGIPFFLGLQAALGTAPNPGRGNLLAALSGLTWALTLIGLRWLRTRQDLNSVGGDPAAATVVCGNVLVFVFSLPAALPVASISALDVGLVVYLGTVQIAVAYVLLTRGLAKVPAFEASLFILAEPVLSVLLTFLIHAERPSVWSIMGGVLILLSTSVKTWVDRRR